ncbi:MAG: hypothetical protein R3236_01775 [Phycisphaeraceae bacterium]|nr:hypothetical protein [Phycisphaeraceae bacterium]
MSEEDDPIDLSMDDETPSSGSAKPRPKIQMIGQAEGPAKKGWSRQPSAETRGACHAKTFFAKLRPDAIEMLDDQINQWLEENPGYEVKFVSTSTGEMMGKQREPTLFVSVWV